MKLSKLFAKLSFTAILTLALFSCKKKYFSPEWDTKILTPIAKSKLSIKDLVKDSDLITTDSNKLMSIVYTNEVYKLENPLDSLVSLSIDPYSTVVTLETLALAEQKINNSITLGSLINQIPSNFPKPSDGSGFPRFFLAGLNSVITGFNTASSDIDISEFLVEAYLQQALFDVIIENSTNFEIINLNYSIKNTEDGVVLIQGVIDTIKPNTTYTDLNIDIAQNLNGQPVKGLLTIEAGGFTLGIPEGLPGVIINYADYISFGANLHDIQVLKATAQFPAQEVVNATEVVDVYADGGVQLTYAKIDTGIVNIKGFSSIPVDIHFTYSVPNLSKDGTQFSISSTLDTTYNSSQNQADTNYFFNNYDFDLTVNSPPFFRDYNSFLNTLVANIDSTDGVLAISLEDSINLTIAVTKIKPSYARGYLGNTSEQVVETIKLGTFSDINGKVNFEKVNLELQFLNDIGVSAGLQINSIVARNTKTGASEVYTGSKGPFVIGKASELGGAYVSQNTTLVLDNAENLLSIFPDEFDVDFEFQTNPSGNDFTYSDFIHSGASITATLNLDVPLVASVEGLTLSDTSEFTINNAEVPAEFKEGIFSLIVDNGFPLDVDLDVYFLNSAGAIIDSLSSEKIIKSAVIDPNTKTVTQSTETKLDYTFDNFDLNALLSATKIVYKARFDTENNQVVKFYDYYNLDVQLVADFDYHITTAN